MIISKLYFKIIVTHAHIQEFIYFRAVYSKRMFVSFKQQSSARSDLYTETEVIPEDSSHYQELDVSEREIPYQNTSLNH